MADPTPDTGHDDDIVLEVRDFYERREGAESDLRSQFTSDLRFAYEPGAQWSSEAKAKRAGRPCYEYNRTAGAINQLVGDQRKMRIGGKVRPETPNAARGLADLFGGMIRDIEAASNARRVYNEAFKYAVAGAWGVWRVLPEYHDDESFDQVLRLRRVANPLNVYFDELADPFGRGSMQVIVAERMSRIAYQATYGDVVGHDVPSTRDSYGWADDHQIRIAEYYRMAAERKKIVLLSDGRTFPDDQTLRDELERLRQTLGDDRAPRPIDERMVDQWHCEWFKVDGLNRLDGPIRYNYRNIPVVRLPGRHINIEGENQYESLHRHGHDAARTYNYNRSTMVETVALTPRAPYLVTAAMIHGYEEEWQKSNAGNAPYLTYNIDPDAAEAGVAGGRPQRERGPEVPAAFIALAQHDAEDLRQTIGYTNPAVEQQTRAGDAESGRALRTRLSANDSGSYEYIDHYEEAVKYTWEIMIDMIPQTYTSKRIARTLGLDGRENFVELDDPSLLKQGKYDVAVTLGPAHATARMEALDTLLAAGEQYPIIGELAADIIVQNLDVRGADQIEDRIRQRYIADGIVQPTEEELARGIQPPQPDPEKEALAERLRAEAARDRASAAETTVKTASELAKTRTAPRRERVELEQEVADLRQKLADIEKTIVETAAARREMNTPPSQGGA